MFVKLPKIVRLFYPNLVWEKKTENKELWLTFDDGPHPDVTPWILSILNAEDIKATFFLLGSEIERFPKLVNDIEKEGHVIGNHSYSHKNGWTTSNKTYFQDVERCQKLIPNNKLYRPPYGKLSYTQIWKLKRNYKLILWDILSMDFSNAITKSKIKENVLNNVENGSIIVFHNNQKSFKNLKLALKEIIVELKKREYTFSTIW